MADLVTHALVGAACAPGHPVAGAIFGCLADLPQIPMNAYMLIRYRKLSTGQAWALTPDWMRDFYYRSHGIFNPAALMFYCWFLVQPLFPFTLAYFSHVLIDVPLHSESTMWWPVSKVMLVGYGKN